MTSRLRPLFDENPAVRKAAARALVGRVMRSDHPVLRTVLAAETSPEVFKWLGMALARGRAVQALPDLRAKKNTCADDNARDWLSAAEAVLQPQEAANWAVLLLGSADVLDRREGAVLSWGARHLDGAMEAALRRDATDSQDSGLRRWAMLARKQHSLLVPATALVDNVNAGDVLLREWSLHVLSSQPDRVALPVVRRIVEGASREHPRVVEWAVRALPALEEDDVVPLLVEVFDGSTDAGVREACVLEVASRLSPHGAEFLVDVLNRIQDPLLAVAVLRGLGNRLRTAPPALAMAVDTSVERLQGSAGLVALAGGALPANVLTLAQRRSLNTMLSNPVIRATLRLRLSTGDEWQGEAVMGADGLVIGVLIALDEEFDYYTNAVGGSLIVESDPKTGATYLLHEVVVPPKPPVKVVVRVVGHKGGDHAAVAVTQLIDAYRPDVVANVGISGSLDKDVVTGMVVVGDSVNAWAANSRIQDRARGAGFDLRLAGESYRPDKWVTDRAAGLRVEAPYEFAVWQAATAALAVELFGEDAPTPAVKRGDLAAGPSVAASDRFKAFLADHKRDYAAIDMESSGVASAAWADAVKRVRLLLLRGVSDIADGNKTRLEEETKGKLRRLAMEAATRYLMATLRYLANTGVPS